jgi:hypothetical protein
MMRSPSMRDLSDALPPLLRWPAIWIRLLTKALFALRAHDARESWFAQTARAI